MTFRKLAGIIKENNIPEDVHLMSDSGWECCATEMNGIFYCKEENRIVITQGGRKYNPYDDPATYICLYPLPQKEEGPTL